jgi:hypothetical protein
MTARARRTMDEGGATGVHSRAESLARRPRCGDLDSARRAAGDIRSGALPAGLQLSTCAFSGRWPCLPSCSHVGPPQPLDCHARRTASRCARHPTARSTRRALWGGPTWHFGPADTGRCPSGLRGASRSARQAVGIPLPQVRLARWARPEGTAREFAALPARQLRACRERRWLNDAHRDARGVEVPAARSGTRDTAAEAEQRQRDGRTRKETT